MLQPHSLECDASMAVFLSLKYIPRPTFTYVEDLMDPNSVPYFRTVKSFADVTVTNSGVDTTTFLDASDGLVNMFNLLGTGVFSFVQADLRNNIHGVRERYSRAPNTSNTLESLVHQEIQEGHRHATGCLLRLLRGLSFTRTALQNSLESKEEELTVSFKRSYDTTLRRHHSFVVRTIVAVAIKACPRRHDFYSRIAQGESQDALEEEMGKWLHALGDVLTRMEEFYDKSGHGKL